MPIVKAALSIAMLGCFVAAAAPAAAGETNTPPQRTYTGRIQMHQAPDGLRVPNWGLDDGRSATEGLVPEKQDLKGVQDLDVTPYVPPISATPTKAEKKRSKNWILPPTADDLKQQGVTKKDDDVDSGWGELADDVKQRQDAAKEKSSKNVEEDEENSDSVDSTENSDDIPLTAQERKKMEEKENHPSSSALKLNNTFEPVGSEPVIDEKKDRKTLGAVVESDQSLRDDGKDETKATTKKPESDTGRDKDSGHAFGADGVWNSDRSWDGAKTAGSALQRTAELLSSPASMDGSGERGLGGLPSMSSQLTPPVAPPASSTEQKPPALDSGLGQGLGLGSGADAPGLDSKVGSGFESPFKSEISMPQPIATGSEGLRGTPGLPSSGIPLIGTSAGGGSGSFSPIQPSQSGNPGTTKTATDPWSQ